jgi:hypothetical protein
MAKWHASGQPLQNRRSRAKVNPSMDDKDLIVAAFTDIVDMMFASGFKIDDYVLFPDAKMQAR